MGLMELGCTLEDFGRPAQPAASNRLRCRAQVVSERYLRENLRDSCVCFVAYVWFHIVFCQLLINCCVRDLSICAFVLDFRTVFGMFGGHWNNSS